MHLASVNSVEEQKEVEEHVISIGWRKISADLSQLICLCSSGMGDEHFWTSGTDQAKEGR